MNDANNLTELTESAPPNHSISENYKEMLVNLLQRHLQSGRDGLTTCQHLVEQSVIELCEGKRKTAEISGLYQGIHTWGFIILTGCTAET